MRIDVDEVRQLYPNPQSVRSHHDATGYCVLGAACCYVGRKYCSFPRPSIAARVLGITTKQAQRIARRNDQGDFDGAWEWLQEATGREEEAA